MQTCRHHVKIQNDVSLKKDPQTDCYLLRETIFGCKDRSLMPATPKHKLRTPLRRLRVLLGDRDAAVPMTQQEFAAEVGLSPQTVQALEYGTRTLTENIQTLITAKTHAKWDPDDEQWRYLNTKTPFSKEIAEMVAPLRPKDEAAIREKLRERFNDILDAIDAGALPGQAMLLNRVLAEHVCENELNVDLDPTEPTWETDGSLAKQRIWLVAKYPPERKKKRTQSVPKQKTDSETVTKQLGLNDAII
jgi:hypothetical protein